MTLNYVEEFWALGWAIPEGEGVGTVGGLTEEIGGILAPAGGTLAGAGNAADLVSGALMQVGTSGAMGDCGDALGDRVQAMTDCSVPAASMGSEMVPNGGTIPEWEVEAGGT